MEIILIQKMKSGKTDSQAKCKETPPICTQFNLDIKKLEQESLLCNPIYRRLYNIVKNDMTRSDLSFRKNLIKELYFLLQITPVMRPQLRDPFLMEVEKMYNVNDHKKIDLASNKLNNLLSIVHSRKESGHSGVIQRPKTGVTWNQNVSPFLRPYTASRQRDQKKQKNGRPQSSKFGDKSTKVQTLDDFCIKEFTTNIQEELEISRQFLQKHRTNHPQYEPIYQQLYNILKKIQPNVPQQPVKQEKQVPKGVRYVRSALVRHNKQNWISPEPNQQQQKNKFQQQGNESQAQQAKVKENDESSSEQEEYLYVNEKPANPYSQTIKIEEEGIDKIDQLYSGNLRKYNHVIGNKLVQAVREDKQIAQKYVYYARVKTAMKRELNRRNESRRLMSAKHSNNSNVKMTRIMPQIQKGNTQVDLSKVVDLSTDPLAIQVNSHNTLPTYNKREFLNQMYSRQLRRFENHNNIQYCKPIQAKKPVKRPLTSYTRFHSPVRFDPMSQQNVKKYNEQILDEIEKIKMKVGGKCYASTENLMKALVVYQAPDKELIPKWQDKNLFYGMMSQGKGKKLKKKGRKGIKLNKSTRK